MMQEHMNVEERQALGSIPFMLIVSIFYSPVVRHFGIIYVTSHLWYNAMISGIYFFFWLMLFLNNTTIKLSLKTK